MALADSKKVQTFTNRAGLRIEQMRVGMAEIKDYRDRLVADGASLSGPPFQGNLNAFNGWINSVDTLLNNPVASGIVAEIVPSHRGEAL